MASASATAGVQNSDEQNTAVTAVAQASFHGGETANRAVMEESRGPEQRGGDSGAGEPTTTAGRGTGYNLRQDRARFRFNPEEAFFQDSPDDFKTGNAGRSGAKVGNIIPVSIKSSSAAASTRSKKKTREPNWTQRETMTLLRIWGTPEFQSHLAGAVHSSWIWEHMSDKINEANRGTRRPVRTGTQCRERLEYVKRNYRKMLKMRARGEEIDLGNIQVYVDTMSSVLAKRSSGRPIGIPRPTATPSNEQKPSPNQSSSEAAVPNFPDVPDSDDDDDEDDDDDDDDEDDDVRGDDIEDLFGQNRAQDVEIDFGAEMSDDNKSTDPTYTCSTYYDATPTANEDTGRPHKRPASAPANRNPKRPKGRPPKLQPPSQDLTVAQAITDAVLRFIDHQQYHLTEQTKILQRYLKFERARMRWEMDMETRRMKWEEERELREEERRQRQEEMEEKRVSDNKDFMLQLAVVLGGSHGSGPTQTPTTASQ